MAFVKKTWKDRIVQYANRRLLTKSGGEVEQVTVTRDEGTISEAGDQFNASNMNDLEQRVEDGLTSLTASDIGYSSGVTVKQAIDSKANTSDIPTVDDFISVRTITTTTNSNGFINATFDTKVIVLSAWATQGDCLIIPFSASSANDKGNNQWWFKVLNDSMQVRANFSITMYVSYIELS